MGILNRRIRQSMIWQLRGRNHDATWLGAFCSLTEKELVSGKMERAASHVKSWCNTIEIVFCLKPIDESMFAFLAKFFSPVWVPLLTPVKIAVDPVFLNHDHKIKYKAVTKEIELRLYDVHCQTSAMSISAPKLMFFINVHLHTCIKMAIFFCFP